MKERIVLGTSFAQIDPREAEGKRNYHPLSSPRRDSRRWFKESGFAAGSSTPTSVISNDPTF